MINLLKNKIRKYSQPSMCMDEDERAENILIEIEKAGMLPPNKELTIAVKTESVECVTRVLNQHRWEEE